MNVGLTAHGDQRHERPRDRPPATSHQPLGLTAHGDQRRERPPANGGVTGHVATLLNDRIVQGVLPVGTRLQSERELAADLGVSRTSVRQAVQALAHRGLLEIRGRSGAYVSEPRPERVSEALSHVLAWNSRAFAVRDLLEIRCILELEAAELAAERRTRDDLREIARGLADSAVVPDKADVTDIEGWCVADVEFHAAIARATHNPLLVTVYDALRDVFLEQRRRMLGVPLEMLERGFRTHQQIFNRIGTGDAEGARRAMRLDLDHAEENLLRVVAEHEGLLPNGARPASPPSAVGWP